MSSPLESGHLERLVKQGPATSSIVATPTMVYIAGMGKTFVETPCLPLSRRRCECRTERKIDCLLLHRPPSVTSRVPYDSLSGSRPCHTPSHNRCLLGRVGVFGRHLAENDSRSGCHGRGAAGAERANTDSASPMQGCRTDVSSISIARKTNVRLGNRRTAAN